MQTFELTLHYPPSVLLSGHASAGEDTLISAVITRRGDPDLGKDAEEDEPNAARKAGPPRRAAGEGDNAIILTEGGIGHAGTECSEKARDTIADETAADSLGLRQTVGRGRDQKGGGELDDTKSRAIDCVFYECLAGFAIYCRERCWV